MIESEDLFKFLKREYKAPVYVKKENLSLKIKKVHQLNEYLRDFTEEKAIRNLTTDEIITIKSRLEATSYIEECIDYLTETFTLKYEPV